MRTFLFVSGAALILLATPVCVSARNYSPLIARDSSQAVQNAQANAFHLSRLRNRAMVRRFYAAGLLVAVPGRTRYYYLHEIPASYRYLRPWAKLFLDRLSQEYYTRFRQRLRVTSLLRTVALQLQLERRNPNAARATGSYRSSHLTGATLDISKRFMKARGQAWMRQVLLNLKRAGYLYAVEEFEEPCFHVMVYPTYRQYVAQLTRHSRYAKVGR